MYTVTINVHFVGDTEKQSLHKVGLSHIQPLQYSIIFVGMEEKKKCTSHQRLVRARKKMFVHSTQHSQMSKYERLCRLKAAISSAVFAA